MATQVIKNYTFNATSKTVTFTDFSTILLERVKLITDATTNAILYNFADSTVATGTVATNVLTLSTVGTAASTDKLMIIYETAAGDPIYDGGQQTMAKSNPVVLASDQTAVPVTGASTGSAVPSTAFYMGVNNGTNLVGAKDAGVSDGTNGLGIMATSLMAQSPSDSNFYRLRVDNPGDGVTNSNLSLFTVARGSVYNGTTWDRLRGDTTNGQWVNVKTSALPTGAALDATLTGGTQQSKLTDGTTIASVVAGDAGQNSQVVNYSRKEVSFTTTTVQAVASTDASNYRYVSVQITSQGTSSSVAFQVSNDNATWVGTKLTSPSSTNTGIIGATGTTGMFTGHIPGRYFRLNVTGISAGTTSGVVEFFGNASQPWAQSIAIQDVNGNPAIPQAGSVGDGVSYPFAAQMFVYTGSQVDRVRTATQATGTTGQGVPASGVMGFDGTNYRRILSDSNGNMAIQLKDGNGNARAAAVNANNSLQTYIPNASNTIAISGNGIPSGTVFPDNAGSYLVGLTGTWVATVQIQLSADGGTTWVNVTGSNSVINAATGSYMGSGNLTANGLYLVDAVGCNTMRVITTAYTSGSVTGTVQAVAGAGVVSIGGIPSIANFASPAAQADADTTMNNSTTHEKSALALFNGTSWDRARGMSGNLTTGDTGAKTATGNGATITNVGNKGIQILIVLGTVSGTTPTAVFKLQGSVDGGTTFYDVPGAATASLTATGNFGISVYPGQVVTAGTTTTGTTATANAVMPRTWRVVWTLGGTTPSFTITSVNYNYLPN